MLEITTSIQNARVSVTIIRTKGEIDSSNYKIFQARAEETIAGGARYLLLDMKEVSYISSAGLRVIHTLFNKLRDLHKDATDDELRKETSAGAYKSPYLKIVHLAEQAKEVFELSGFDVYIEAYSDPQRAVESFQPPSG
ncbi:MAG: STAS domain-containing protein [Chloroflexi bacterium]|nr:STAS domain-containing protein [Chloroflexota bacterium]